jgi:hypothetical protein
MGRFMPNQDATRPTSMVLKVAQWLGVAALVGGMLFLFRYLFR